MRGRRRKEFRGRAVSVWRVILPAFGLLFAASDPGTSGPPSWWEIRLHLTAKGQYTVKELETTYSGEFLYRAQWQGTMERDGADFLLYYTTMEPQAWELREKASPPGAARVMTEKETREKPRLRVNYVLRKGADILFDFEVAGFPIPLNPSADKFDLVFPRSRERAAAEDTYGRFVVKGKNLVSVDEQDLGKRPLERSFSWEWKRQEWILREKEVILVAGSHKASVTVTLIPHD
jgi:hypothetical protein